jgi:hypothetical protein
MSLPRHCRSYVPAVTLEIVYKPMHLTILRISRMPLVDLSLHYPIPALFQVLKAAPRGIWANSHLLQAAQKTTRQIRLIPAYGEMPS